MRVFLVQAAAYSPATERSMPLGIMYLASFLRAQLGAEVRLFDMQLGARDPAPVVADARAFKPDIIGVSGLTSDARAMDAVTRALRRTFPGAPILVGGPQTTCSAAETIRNADVDYLIAGEGETAFASFVNALAAGRDVRQTPNLWRREDGGVRANEPAPFIEDLDSLPFPAFDLIDRDAYWRIPRCGVIYWRRRYAAIITSRGCPYHCGYCHSLFGRKWRARSAENVVAEMERWVREYGVGEFVFMDDMFNWSAERVEHVAQLILERGLNVSLHFPIGLRGDIMTERGVTLLTQAGLHRCMYAVETASERLQILIRKNNKLDRLRHIIEFTRRQGVMVHGAFMLGFPTETEDEARATVDWAARSALHTAAFYRVIPFRGTLLAELAAQAGREPPAELPAYEFHRAAAVNVSAMPDAALTRLRRKAYRRFYLSPRRLWGILRALPNRRTLLPLLFATWVRKAFLW